jgi:hypothetical protein
MSRWILVGYIASISSRNFGPAFAFICQTQADILPKKDKNFFSNCIFQN